MNLCLFTNPSTESPLNIRIYMMFYTFVLAIQTIWQRELYRKFSTTILCIDSTHGTNAHQFKLITCVVPGNSQNGKLYLKHVTTMHTNVVSTMGCFVPALAQQLVLQEVLCLLEKECLLEVNTC